MQSHHSAASEPSVRPVRKVWATLARHRRSLLIMMLVLALGFAGTTGYLLGDSQPAEAAAVAAVTDDSGSIAAFSGQLSADNELCTLVEQVNLQEQLQDEKLKSAELEDNLVAQQEEMDNLESTILGALMANLTEQEVSRSSKTVTSYRQEAKNLIELQNKLEDFLETDTASQIDLTTYQDALEGRLEYLPTIKPIPGVYDGYGYRRHPIYGYYHFHPAADVGSSTGTKIHAAASGTVVEAKYSSGSGYYVKINHRNGFTTTYMHCSKLLVSAGDRVSQGDVIALVGSTGSSTEPHLHYEIRFYGEPLNPRSMIMG